MSISLYEGDCLDVLKTLEAESVDAICTDPPYHLTQLSRGGSPRINDPATPFGRTKLGDRGFMGLNWDGGDIAFRTEVWEAILRVLKPGGHLLSFGGTRTYHRMAVAIEDAGFEIRDQIGWVYGSGFPKSASSLKPAWEPIVLARRPLRGTVAHNTALYGTGSINIEPCRVPTSPRPHRIIDPKPEANGAVYVGRQNAGHGFDGGSKAVGLTDQGRWPANITHDGSDEVMSAFAIYGDRGASAPVQGHEPSTTGQNGIYGHFERVPGPYHDDEGTAARFFKTCEWTYLDDLFTLLYSYDIAILDECNAKTVGCQLHQQDEQSDHCVSDAANQSDSCETNTARSHAKAEIRSVSDFLAPFMNATESELSLICDTLTTMIQMCENVRSHKQPPAELTLKRSHVNGVAIQPATDTMTIMISLSTSDGSVISATYSITSRSMAHGEKDFAAQSRFTYCAKTSKAERAGSKHPTIKPVSLMRYLCKLITPPGGTVLDPFAGSGTTGQAAADEGFNAILIEREAAYCRDIRRRLALHLSDPSGEIPLIQFVGAENDTRRHD